MSKTAPSPLKHRLPAKPVVKNLSDIAVALQELSYLASVDSEETAKLNAAIAVLKEASANRRVSTIDGQTIANKDRRQALADAIEKCVKRKPQLITETGKKTRKFTHGDVSLRSTKLSVSPEEDLSFDDVLAALLDQGPRRFIRTVKSVDVTRILQDLQEEKIGDEDLANLHLVRVEPQDEVNVKLSAYTVDAPAVLDRSQ